MFSCFSFLATAYSLDAFKTLFKTYKFSHSEDDIIASTAKIGLANDGPGLYIGVLEYRAHLADKLKGKLKEHSREDASAPNCDTKNFEGVRSGGDGQQVRKRMAKQLRRINKWERMIIFFMVILFCVVVYFDDLQACFIYSSK